MNNRDLLRAMGEIDEKYIEEAAKEIRTAEAAPEELPAKAASETPSAKAGPEALSAKADSGELSAKAAEMPDPAAKVEHISAARKKKNGKYRAATQWILYVAAAAVALLVAGRFLMPVTQKETAKTETAAVESTAAKKEKAAEREKTAAEEAAAMEVDEEAVPVQGMTADEADAAGEAAAMEEDEEAAPVQGMTAGEAADEATGAEEAAAMEVDEEAGPVQGMTADEAADEATGAEEAAGRTDNAAWTDAEEAADFAEEEAFYAEEAEDDNGWYAPETGAAAYAPETAAAYASGEEADAAEADAAEEGAGAGPVEEDHGTYTFLRTDKPFDTADYPGGSYYLVGLKLVWVFKDGDGIRTAVWGDESYTARIDAKEGALTPEAFREAYRACS